MGRRLSNLEIMSKVHWSVGVITGLVLFVLVRFGGVWFISKLLASMAISPVGSMPPTVPQSTIDSLTCWAVAALLLCWLMALLSHLARRKNAQRAP